MALTDDQKALLRLLAQREDGYEDIAALLGLSVPEVRAKVKDALADLNEVEAPAAPPAPAAAAQPTPEPEPVAEPQPSADRPSQAKPSPAAGKPKPRPRPKALALPKQRRRLAQIIGGFVAILLLILFATGTLNIGDSGDGDSSENAAQNREVTQAVLIPPDDGKAIGAAVFGRQGKEPVMQVQAEGLAPTAAGTSYTVWLYRSPKLNLRVGAVKAPKGGIAARFPIPLELLGLVSKQGFNRITITLTDDAEYNSEMAAARKARRLPAFSGETVLSGPIMGPLAER